MSGHACDGNAVVTGLDCFVVVVSIDVFSVGESVVVDGAAGPVVVAVGREEKDLVEKDRLPAEGEGKGRSHGEHARVRGKKRCAPAAMDGG